MTTTDKSLDSISIAICQLRSGQRSSVDLLLQRYFRRLSGLAASRLNYQPDLKSYAEDIANSALKSVCLRVERGMLEGVRGRDDLWRLLATITVRKTISFLRSHKSARQTSEFQLAGLLTRDPDPAQALEFKTQVQRLYDLLEDDQMRMIANLKVDGYSNAEIARRIGCVERTVERRLHRIRAIWQKELEPNE